MAKRSKLSPHDAAWAATMVQDFHNLTWGRAPHSWRACRDENAKEAKAFIEGRDIQQRWAICHAQVPKSPSPMTDAVRAALRGLEKVLEEQINDLRRINGTRH